jgi:hypothetical protein
VLSRGIPGIDERIRGLAQRWFDMVDWKSANVGSAQSGVSRSIEGHTKKLEGEVHRQHPARVWVERKERKPPAKEPERTSTTHACASQLSQLANELHQDVTGTATEIDWRAADPSRNPKNVCRVINRMTGEPIFPACRSTRLRLMGALSLTRRKPRGRSGLHSTPGLARLVPRRCTPSFHRDHRWIIQSPLWGWITGHAIYHKSSSARDRTPE